MRARLKLRWRLGVTFPSVFVLLLFRIFLLPFSNFLLSFIIYFTSLDHIFNFPSEFLFYFLSPFILLLFRVFFCFSLPFFVLPVAILFTCLQRFFTLFSIFKLILLSVSIFCFPSVFLHPFRVFITLFIYLHSFYLFLLPSTFCYVFLLSFSICYSPLTF